MFLLLMPTLSTGIRSLKSLHTRRKYTDTTNPIFGETESIDRKVEAVDNQSHQTTQARQKSVHSQSPTGANSSETSGYIFEPDIVLKRKPTEEVQGKLFKTDISVN